METTKSEGWRREKVQFGLSSPKYVQFSVLDRGTQSGPKRANRHHLGGNIRTKHDKKAAHTLPAWIISMDEDTKPLWRPTCPVFGDFGPFLACFGLGPVRAEIVSFGQMRNVGGKCTLRGEGGPDPKMIF